MLTPFLLLVFLLHLSNIMAQDSSSTPLAPFPQEQGSTPLAPYPTEPQTPVVAQYPVPIPVPLPVPVPAPVPTPVVPTQYQPYGQPAYTPEIGYATTPRTQFTRTGYGHQQPVGYPAATPVRSPLLPPYVRQAIPFAQYANPLPPQNTVLVAAQPLLQTRRYEVRRPAIQKHFYDVEQSVVVRPVGSALVELETPLSTLPRSPGLPISTDVRETSPRVSSRYTHGAQAELLETYRHQELRGLGGGVRHRSQPIVVNSDRNYESVDSSDGRGTPSSGSASSIASRSRGSGSSEREGSAALENQRRLLELLTARDGVVDIGFGRIGAAVPERIGDAGFHRARVLAAHTNPELLKGSSGGGGSVNTRRVVISRPIETVQEVEVSEPITRITGEQQHLIPQRYVQAPLIRLRSRAGYYN